MLSRSWTALFVFALALDVGFCATTKEYTVNIGTQATIVGYEYDYPPGRLFAGIPYAQSMAATNRFMVCNCCVCSNLLIKFLKWNELKWTVYGASKHVIGFVIIDISVTTANGRYNWIGVQVAWILIVLSKRWSVNPQKSIFSPFCAEKVQKFALKPNQTGTVRLISGTGTEPNR